MRVTIKVKTENLPPHTEEDLEEWLKWELGVSGSMKCSNPLSDYSMETDGMIDIRP